MTDDYLDLLRAMSASSGLHAQHFRALALICGQPSLPREVQQRLGLSYAQTMRILATLRKRRLIERDLWSAAPRAIRPTLAGRAFDARARSLATTGPRTA